MTRQLSKFAGQLEKKNMLQIRDIFDCNCHKKGRMQWLKHAYKPVAFNLQNIIPQPII